LKATKLLSTLLAIKTIQVFDFNEDFSFFFYYIYIFKHRFSFFLLSFSSFIFHCNKPAITISLKKPRRKKIMSLTSLTIFLLKHWLYVWETIERRKIRKIVACVQGWVVHRTYLSWLFLIFLSFFVFYFIFEVVFVFWNWFLKNYFLNFLIFVCY
jgi:hypothetical protein